MPVLPPVGRFRATGAFDTVKVVVAGYGPLSKNSRVETWRSLAARD